MGLFCMIWSLVSLVGLESPFGAGAAISWSLKAFGAVGAISWSLKAFGPGAAIS